MNPAQKPAKTAKPAKAARKSAKPAKLAKASGFTIIEVALVLAIAGLIFLVVFLALPALQQSQRNTARKQDVAKIVAAIERFYADGGTNADVPTPNAFGDSLYNTTIAPYLKNAGTYSGFTCIGFFRQESFKDKLMLSPGCLAIDVDSKCAQDSVLSNGTTWNIDPAPGSIAVLMGMENPTHSGFCQTATR